MNKNWKTDLTGVVSEALIKAGIPVYEGHALDIVGDAVEQFCTERFTPKPQQPDPAESTDADKGVCECGHDRNQHRVSLTGYRPCSICWNDLEDGIEKDICRDFKAAQQPEPSEVCETDFEDAEAIAKFFHYTYERLAPDFGYETRPDTKQFDAESPNGKLMIAVCGEFLAGIRKPATPPASEQSEVCGNCDQLAQTQAALKRLYHAEIKRRSVNDPLGMNAAMEEAGKWF